MKRKKFLAFGLSAILLVSSLCTTAPIVWASASEASAEIDFLDGYPDYSVESVERLTDFSGNRFLFYNLAPIGYAIYDANEQFIEGSYWANSPYDEYEGARYYLGPATYLVQDAIGLYDIANDTYRDAEQFATASFRLPE